MRASITSAKSSSAAASIAAGLAANPLPTSWLGGLGPDLDLVIVALDDKPVRDRASVPGAASRASGDKWRMQLRGCLVAVALCALITLIASQWLIAFDAANLVMIYLLAWWWWRCSFRPLAVGAGDGDQRHQLRSVLYCPPRDAGRLGRAVSADLRGDARRRADDRQSDRRRALSGAGGALPRTARAPSV